MQKRTELKSGETLIEIVVALFALTLFSAASTLVIVSALSSTRINKNNLAALNLAREGIELVRNIRDTNWLKYADKTCWNTIPEKDDCSNKITNGNYQILLDSDFKKVLLKSPGGGDSSELDLKNGEDDFFRIKKFNDLLTHTTESNAEPTKYFRMISIEPLDDTNQSVGADSATKMRVTSLIQWQEGSRVKEIKRIAVLSNYQDIP